MNAKLLKNSKIEGRLLSKNNNLGLIILPFKSYVKPEFSKEDTLLFRIKQEGASEWYYSGKYGSGLIEFNKLFPFGFPVISDSANKVYFFELISLKGNDNNAVEINGSDFIAGFQNSKHEIFSDKLLLTFFIRDKIVFNFQDINFILSSIIFLIPLIGYLFWFFVNKKKSRVKKYLWILFLLLASVDLFLIKEFYLGIMILILMMWIYSILIYKIDNRINFYLAFSLVFFWVIFNYLGIHNYSEKINIWTYSFLVIGIIQMIYEYRKS